MKINVSILREKDRNYVTNMKKPYALPLSILREKSRNYVIKYGKKPYELTQLTISVAPVIS
jgi:hypothetical protein